MGRGMGKWKVKWKFEKWKALLAHMSVFIISKKPVLASRLFELFAERLQVGRLTICSTCAKIEQMFQRGEMKQSVIN